MVTTVRLPHRRGGFYYWAEPSAEGRVPSVNMVSETGGPDLEWSIQRFAKIQFGESIVLILC